jgi:hypothetical protein
VSSRALDPRRREADTGVLGEKRGIHFEDKGHPRMLAL